MRLRLSLVAALGSLAIGLTAVPGASAANRTTEQTSVTNVAPLYTAHVTGVAKKQKFTGTFAIERYAVKGHKVFAIGTLRGMVKGHHVTRSGVAIPASLTGASANGAARDAAATGCPVLHLVLAPITLNLLGLNVTLGGGTLANQPIVLDITAVPGAGNLLGNLLCDLTNALNQGGVLSQLQSQLGQLSATLTALSSLLGKL